MKALRLPAPHLRLLIGSSSGCQATLPVRVAPQHSRAAGGAFPSQNPLFRRWSIAGIPSRGRVRDLSGSLAIRPVPLPSSMTPAEPTLPRRSRSRQYCPRPVNSEGFSDNYFEACTRLQHLLPTLQELCYQAQARLASGWLAGLYRRGVEPPGSQQKVSDRLHARPPFQGFALTLSPSAAGVRHRSSPRLRAASAGRRSQPGACAGDRPRSRRC